MSKAFLARFKKTLGQKYEILKEGTTFAGAGVEDIRDHYEAGTEVHEKRASTYALQLAVDAYVEDEITFEEYQEVEDSARQHVQNYYFDQDNETELVLPDTDKTTKQFLFHQNEDMIGGFQENQLENYEGDPDIVVAVASGGLEPGMIAAEYLNTDYGVVRKSRWRKGDSEVHNIHGNFEGRDALIVEDKDGDTMKQVEKYLRQQEVANVDTISVV